MGSGMSVSSEGVHSIYLSLYCLLHAIWHLMINGKISFFFFYKKEENKKTLDQVVLCVNSVTSSRDMKMFAKSFRKKKMDMGN